jgi:hypothetical protein
MALLLSKLGVPRNVRLFFEPHYHVLPDGSIIFPFGEDTEHFSDRYHFVPSTVIPWNAGNGPLVFISFSAMEALAFLSIHYHSFPDFRLLQFIAIGNYLTALDVTAAKISLLFGSDILGRLTDIKVSLLLRNKNALIFYNNNGFFVVNGQQFNGNRLTLFSFEKKLGIRSGIRTIKPRAFNTFLEQLKHQNL